jgi:hypothetical protein
MNHHSDFHRLSPEQQVSLDKHQQMINSALMWQKHDRLAKARQEPRSMASLRSLIATVLNIFTK